MANVARPQGARPKGSPERMNSYVAGGDVYPGDLVKLDSSGRVVVAAASDALCGVCASKGIAGDNISVWDDPKQLFIIGSNGANPDAQTDINLNYDFVAAAADTVFKISRMVLNQASGAATATLPLKLLGVEKRPNNDLGANADCIVRINNHQLAGGTGTVGV